MCIPDKIFFKIGEVAELVGVEPYVLRYWETEFKTLCPNKNEKGQRLYKKKEVKLALDIKKLLYEEGYTIEGAKKVLRERSRKSGKGPTQLSIPYDRDRVVEIISELKKDLRDLVKQLS